MVIVGLFASYAANEFCCLQLHVQYQYHIQPLIMSGYFRQSKWWFHGFDSGSEAHFQSPFKGSSVTSTCSIGGSFQTGSSFRGRR